MHPESAMVQGMGMLRMREGEQETQVPRLMKYTVELQIGQTMYLLLKPLVRQTQGERWSYIGLATKVNLAELRVFLRVILERKVMHRVLPDTEVMYKIHVLKDTLIPGPRIAAATARIICVPRTESTAEDTATLLLCLLYLMAMKSQEPAYLSMRMVQKSPG